MLHLSFKNIIRDVHEIKTRETSSSVTSKLIGAVTKIKVIKCCDECNITGVNKHCLCKENVCLWKSQHNSRLQGMGLTKPKNCILYEKLVFEQFGSFQLEMPGAPGRREIQAHTSGLQHSESSPEPRHSAPWGRALSLQHWQSSSLPPSFSLSRTRSYFCHILVWS